MENSVIIYKILKAIEKSMDYEDFDDIILNPDVLKTTEIRRDKLLIEMQRNDYIKGLRIKSFPNSGQVILKPLKPEITLKGIEYLENNSVMKKAADIVKGVVEIIT